MNKNRPRARIAPVWIRYGLGVILILVLGSVATLKTRDAREALSYWRTLREKSIDVTERFIHSAATGDTMALAGIATDSVIQEVKFYHRTGYANDLISAAEGFDVTNVQRYGYGARVVFNYHYKNSVRQTGTVTTMFDDNALRVVSFAMPVKFQVVR